MTATPTIPVKFIRMENTSSVCITISKLLVSYVILKCAFNSFFFLLCVNSGSDVIESGPPLFEKVKEATKGIRSQWYSLAVQLGISHSIRQVICTCIGTPACLCLYIIVCSLYEQIIREKHYFVEPCFHSMIQHWVSRTSPPPTKAALIEAVESPVIDHKNLVAKISRIPVSLVNINVMFPVCDCKVFVFQDSEFQRSTFVYPEVKSDERIHVHRGLGK